MFFFKKNYSQVQPNSDIDNFIQNQIPCMQTTSGERQREKVANNRLEYLRRGFCRQRLERTSTQEEEEKETEKVKEKQDWKAGACSNSCLLHKTKAKTRKTVTVDSLSLNLT